MEKIIAVQRTGIHDPAFAGPVYRRAVDPNIGGPGAECTEQSYGAFLRASLPQWLGMMDPAPWIAAGMSEAATEPGSAATLFRQQAATLAAAVLLRTDHPGCDSAYLQECIRASLIRWQLSLRSDGVPRRQSLKQSPLCPLIAESVMHVVGQCGTFESDMLIDDLERHVAWIGRKRTQAPWLEATIIALLADTAVFLRDRSVLAQARQRLASLLQEQNAEGWFPERGGPDLGRLSVVVDALARLHRNMNWGELAKPIQSAVSFILHCLRPDGSVGGCISSCGTGFISPYGIELTAPAYPEAATLALACRRRIGHYAKEALPAWHSDLWAHLGPRIALASSIAREHTAPPALAPHRVLGETRFPHAGISIHCRDRYHAIVGARSGGAVQLCWRNGTSMEEPGVSVSYSRGARTAGRWHRRVQASYSATGVTAQGALRQTYRSSESRPSALWSALVRFIGGRRSASRLPPPNSAFDNPRKVRPRTHDMFRREITFGEDTVQIRDVVDARIQPLAIVCQSPPSGESSRLVDGNPPDGTAPPLYIDGDRHVEIVREYGENGLVSIESQTGSE